MPIYCFSCELGHVTEGFFFPTEPMPQSVACKARRCGRTATRDFSAEHKPDQTIFRPFFSTAVGKMINSRDELRQSDRDMEAAGFTYVGRKRGG